MYILPEPALQPAVAAGLSGPVSLVLLLLLLLLLLLSGSLDVTGVLQHFSLTLSPR